MSHFKLVFFVPRTHTQATLCHLFEKYPKELGKIGDYEQCAFVSPGTGQFKPGPNANPTIGRPGQLEFVQEDRVELVVNAEPSRLRLAIRDLKEVHPYEEVAYDVYRLEDF